MVQKHAEVGKWEGTVMPSVIQDTLSQFRTPHITLVVIVERGVMALQHTLKTRIICYLRVQVSDAVFLPISLFACFSFLI